MRQLLIIKPSSFGDIIHGLQVMQTLRLQRPDVQITWVARDIFVPLVAAATVVDRVLPFQRSGGLRAFGRLLREVRACRYDYVLDLQGLARSGLLALLARGKYKIGRADAREGAGCCYTDTVALPVGKGSLHALAILLPFLEVFGVEPVLQGELSFRCESALAKQLPFNLEQAILLFPESRRPEKVWPHFDALLPELRRCCPDCPLVWVAERTPPVASAKLLANFHDFTGQTTLADVIALVRSCATVITNDSGPMHLAAALRKRIVAIFGPTDPERFGPYPLGAPRHRVLRHSTGDIKRVTVAEVLACLEPGL